MREKTLDLQHLHTADSGIYSGFWGRVLYCFLFLSASAFLHVLNLTPAKSENYVTVSSEVAWPGDSINVRYKLTGVDRVRISWGGPGEEILEPGAVTDWPSYSGPQTFPSDCSALDENALPAECVKSFTLRHSTSFTIVPADEGPSPKAEAIVYMLYGLGYEGARTPLGGVYRPVLDRLSSALSEIAQKLNNGCIRNNMALDRFNDQYLRGPLTSGTNDLTSDILTKMSNLLIYTARWQLPAALRDISTLCNPSEGWGHPNLDGVAICSELGAGGLTLLHELYHFAAYASGNDYMNGCKSSVIAQMCYDFPDPGSGPDQYPDGKPCRSG